MLEAVFLILAGLGLYHLLGYPILLFILPKKREERLNNKEDRHKISLIIAAYNEEKFIEEKIKNSLGLDYDDLEIIVVSDGSTDRTNETCKKYADQIKFIELPQRRGKFNALNTAVPHSKGDLLLFSDANAFYKRDAVKVLAKHFGDPKVGCATGRVKLIAKRGAHKEGEAIYTALESFIQAKESHLHSVIGIYGAMYMVRRFLYTPLKSFLIEDFVTGMMVIKKGFRVVYETKAFGWEKSSISMKDEFIRKSRIVAGGFQSLKVMGFLFKKPLILWSFVSHKLLRWLLAELLIAVFILNIFLLDNPVYRLFFYIQISAYFLAFLGAFIKPLSPLFYFIVMQASSLAGLIKFLFGLQSVKWEKAKRV